MLPLWNAISPKILIVSCSEYALLMKVIPEGSSAMPGKSDDEGTIVAIVCWPEWLHDDGDGDGVFLGWYDVLYLTVCHQFLQVFANCRKI